jgi:tRNA nucleotidyltransferase (CCA-adding enzyme)
LDAKLLRHVSPAFAEDPVRLLRVARFAARWPDFTVAPETQVLLKRLVDEGEVDALVPERVWQELSRGLMEVRPSRLLQVLADCGAAARLLSGVLVDGALQHLLDTAATLAAPLPVRYALLGPGDETLAERLKVPTDCRELALLLGREGQAVAQGDTLSAREMLALFDRSDAWRRPARFAELLRAGVCIACAHGHPPDQPWPPADRLTEALRRAQGVDTATVAREAAAAGARGPAIGQAVGAARLQAIAET